MAMTSPTRAAQPDMAVRRLSGTIGAEVTVGLDRLLGDADTQRAMRAALHEHLVLVLRALAPTPSQLSELGRAFGALQPVESYNVAHPHGDAVTVFDSEQGYKADEWHSDASWREVVPMGAALCMVRCPEVGGDTLWANCQAAYEDLSEGMKHLLTGRRALHEIGQGSETEHPVVVSHPVTGRPVLYVNRLFTRRITNLPRDESDALLPFLVSRVSRPEYSYRHHWAEGDVLIWDNWATQHYAVFDYDQTRTAHRVSFVGDRLAAAPR